MTDLARLRADEDIHERDAHSLLSALVQILAARIQLRREIPEIEMRQHDEATAAEAIDRIFKHLVQSCEQRILVREQIDAAEAKGRARPLGRAVMH